MVLRNKKWSIKEVTLKSSRVKILHDVLGGGCLRSRADISSQQTRK